jgi:hypothetical protein
MMDDAILMTCNESELFALAQRQKIGRLRRGLPKEVLVGLVTGEITLTRSHLAGTAETRAELQKFIADNIAIARSQLPGCDGCCTSYPCSEGRHALCYAGNR